MKKFSKSIRFMLATVALVASQIAAHAEGNSVAGTNTGLSGMQVAGAFAVLVLVILLPLVKSQKPVANKF